MSHPRRVLADVDVPWTEGGGTLHVRRGTLVECPPGSALETAYGGAGNLQDVTADLGSADTLDKSALSN